MPCALTSNFDYPDYIKSILKEIEVGNDENLKFYACQLKTPLTDEGCPMFDENQKVGLFPFCIEKSSSVGQGTNYPIGFTLKELMNFYWKTKSIKFNVNVNPPQGLTFLDSDFIQSKPAIGYRYGFGAGTQPNGSPAQIQHMKELVGGSAMFVGLFYYSQSQNGFLNIFNAGEGGASVRYYNGLFYPFIHFFTSYVIDGVTLHSADTVPDLFLVPDYYGNTAAVKGNIKISSFAKNIDVYSYPQYCYIVSEDPLEVPCITHLPTYGTISINEFDML